jgi:tetratricopeptide (TPR) repeat protein
VIYLQTVEGLRRDVLNVNKYGYIEDRVFPEVFRGKEPPRLPPPTAGGRGEKERYLVEHSGRPVYFTTKAQVGGLRGYELVTWGLVFEAVKEGVEPDEAAHRKLWESMQFHPGSLYRERGEFGNDLILADYHYARARRALLFGGEEEALGEFRAADHYGAGLKAIHNNLGGALAEAGNYRAAVPFLRRALIIDPNYDLAIRNYANVLFALERYDAGLPWFLRALDLDFRNGLFELALARGYKARGKKHAARSSYELLLLRDPQNQALRKEYEEFLDGAFGKKEVEEYRKLRKEVAERSRAAPGHHRPDRVQELSDFTGHLPGARSEHRFPFEHSLDANPAQTP